MDKNGSTMTITLQPYQIFRKILYLLLLLLGANLLGIFSKLYLGHDQLYGLIPLFDFNTEKNIPTLYSAIALLTAGALLAFVASNYKRRKAPYMLWVGLSVIFIFLSVDEQASIHESTGRVIKQVSTTSGALFYAWVIPYGIGLLVFFMIYARFTFRLPNPTRNLFLASGFIYVSGAMGLEMLGGIQFQISGTRNLIYALLYTCEEFLEMFAVALFIYAILKHIVSEFGPQKIAITPDCPT
jgi:hypothetical protein